MHNINVICRGAGNPCWWGMLWRWWKLLPWCHVRDCQWKEMPVLDINGTSSTWKNTSEVPERVRHYTKFHHLELLQALALLISLAAVMFSPIMQRSEEEPVQKPRWWSSPLVLHHRSHSSVGVLQHRSVWQQAQHTGTPYRSNKTSPSYSATRFIHLQDNRLYQRSRVPLLSKGGCDLECALILFARL